MRPQAFSQLRIARPSRDLHQAERFWVDGLGLEVLYRAGTDAEGGHALLMLGWPKAAWHLELVEDPNGETPPSSTDEDLLVLYVGGLIDDEVAQRLAVVDEGRQRQTVEQGAVARFARLEQCLDGVRCGRHGAS